MKNILKKLSFILVISSFMLFTSCDELSELTLNVPLPIEFSTSGSNTSLSENEYFCLSQYEEWRDNQDDIESAKFLTASYWTLDGTTPNLRGDVSFSLYSGGVLLFTYNFGTITAADYETDPYELMLTESQIQAFDNVLSNLFDNDACFTGTLTVNNVTGDTDISGNRVLNGKVELVLETEVKVD